jgi:HAMP domain-containing protein
MRDLTVAQRIYLIAGASFAIGFGLTGTLLLRQRASDAAYQGLIAGPIQARRHTLNAQVHFKTQMQEWKNVLLRGYKADAREKYAKAFHEEATVVRAALDSVRGDIGGDTTAASLVAQFAAAHDSLGAKYDAALQVFAASDGLDAVAADSAVKGRDRAPTELLGSLADHISARVNAEVEARHVESERERALFAGAALALFAGVAALAWGTVRRITRPLNELVRVADGVARGDVDQAITYARRNDSASAPISSCRA